VWALGIFDSRFSEDLAVTLRGDIGGDHDRPGDDLAKGTVFESGEPPVETGASPAYLGLGEAVDPGLHHHRAQGLIDPATRSKDLRKEIPFAELRDTQLEITGLGAQHPRPVTVAMRNPIR